MSLPRIVIATRNARKVSEFATLLGNGCEVCDLAAWSHLPAVEEDGATFGKRHAKHHYSPAERKRHAKHHYSPAERSP